MKTQTIGALALAVTGLGGAQAQLATLDAWQRCGFGFEGAAEACLLGATIVGFDAAGGPTFFAGSDAFGSTRAFELGPRARADVPRGTVGVAAESDLFSVGGQRSIALLRDWVTVRNMAPGTSYTGVLTAFLDGTLESSGFGLVDGQPVPNAGQAEVAGIFSSFSNGESHSAVFTRAAAGGFNDGYLVEALTVPFTVTASAPRFSMQIVVEAQTSGGAQALFDRTFALQIPQLPPGITFTSDSGLLFTSAVPEPSTLAQALCGGLLLAGLWVRRKSHTT